MSFEQCDKTKGFAGQALPTISSEDLLNEIRYATHRGCPKDDAHRTAQDIQVLAIRFEFGDHKRDFKPNFDAVVEVMRDYGYSVHVKDMPDFRDTQSAEDRWHLANEWAQEEIVEFVRQRCEKNRY